LFPLGIQVIYPEDQLLGSQDKNDFRMPHINRPHTVGNTMDYKGHVMKEVETFSVLPEVRYDIISNISSDSENDDDNYDDSPSDMKNNEVAAHRNDVKEEKDDCQHQDIHNMTERSNNSRSSRNSSAKYFIHGSIPPENVIKIKFERHRNARGLNRHHMKKELHLKSLHRKEFDKEQAEIHTNYFADHTIMESPLSRPFTR